MKKETPTTYCTHKVELEIRGQCLTIEFVGPEEPPMTADEVNQICKSIRECFDCGPDGACGPQG